MEIVILRHGEPNIALSKNMSAPDYLRWLDVYAVSRICQSSIPEDNVISLANRCNVVVCSDLPRSFDSAIKLGVENKVILNSSIFNEAGMPVGHCKYLKFSPKIWSVFFRMLWLFGYSTNSESFKEAKVRASIAAKILVILAGKHKRVLFVGHGVFNRLLVKELRLLSWSGSKNPGSKYWSHAVYVNLGT